MEKTKNEQQFDELLKKSSIAEIENYISELEDYDYTSFCSANSIAAALYTHSSFIWDENLPKAKAVILAFCKIYSADGIIELEPKNKSEDSKYSITFPKIVKSVNQVTIINFLGEDCGYPDTNYSIFSIADDLLNKHNLSIEITEWITIFDRMVSESEINELVENIKNELNKEKLNIESDEI